MAAAKSSKVTITHPRTGTTMDIDKSIYDPIKAAIIQSLKNKKGISFADLSDEVVKITRKKMPDFKGSIPWYTISIRHDLETRGVVETFLEKGKRLNRLAIVGPSRVRR